MGLEILKTVQFLSEINVFLSEDDLLVGVPYCRVCGGGVARPIFVAQVPALGLRLDTPWRRRHPAVPGQLERNDGTSASRLVPGKVPV